MISFCIKCSDLLYLIFILTLFIFYFFVLFIRFALRAAPSLMIECATHFESKGELEKAVQLFYKVKFYQFFFNFACHSCCLL